MKRARLKLLWVTAIALAMSLAGSAAAQPPERPAAETPPAPQTTPPLLQTTPGSIMIPGPPLPSVLVPPRWGPDLLLPPTMQGPLSLTPSLTVREEYNDNIFLSNRNRESDFITAFTPGLTLAAQERGFNFTAGYNFTAEIYAQHSELNNAANRHNFLTSASYAATPRLTLGLSDVFAYDKNSNAASVQGVSSGRRGTLSNVFTPTMDYQLTQRTTLRLLASYALERFSGSGGRDADTYRFGAGVSVTVTPRLNLTAGYDFGYFDIEDEEKAMTHTPRVGGSYQITPTLTAALSGGPSFRIDEDGDTSVSPSISASLTQATSWGSMSLSYSRAISTSSGLGGTSDNQTIAGDVIVSTLVRGLAVSFSPRYTTFEGSGGSQLRGDVNALTLNLSLRYQLARYVSLVGAYTFFDQHGDGSGQSVDATQNRVTLGLQFGYPINFY